MSNPARRAELFAVEAEEFLADLETLIAAPAFDDIERLVRGARSLRGAAMFAGFGTYARAAAALEALARRLRNRTLDQDTLAKNEVAAAVQILRTLLPKARGWESADDREALQLAERLERLSGRGDSPAPPNTPMTLTSGVRAFIARESGLIADSLDRAARALSPLPPGDALAAVLERMRSLRGLGGSGELSPLPELLDAMEITTRTLLSGEPQPPEVAEVFQEAARALAAMAQGMTATGRVIAPPELDRVALRLLSAYAEATDVVPIESLAPAHGEALLQRGEQPEPVTEEHPVPIELVSVGDHLAMIAGTLARPSSPAVRDLRLFVLHRTLATMPSRSATAHFLRPLLDAITTTIATRKASQHPGRFIDMLLASGRFLLESGNNPPSQSPQADRDQLIASFDQADSNLGEIVPIASLAPDDVIVKDEDLVLRAPVDVETGEFGDFAWDIVPMEAIIPDPDLMRRERDAALHVTVPVAPPRDDWSDESMPVVGIHTLLANDMEDLVGTPIVHIESLLTDAARHHHEGLIPDTAPGGPTRLESALTRERQLSTMTVNEAPSLEGLLGQEVTPIDSLLYRGASALTRAAEVRSEIAARLQTPGVGIEAIRESLDELLDLVALASDAS